MRKPRRASMAMRSAQSRNIIPSTATLIGELGSCVISDPRACDDFYVLDYVPGRLIVAYGDREMFIINPLSDEQRSYREQAMHLDDAFDLYETFTGLQSDHYFNLRLPMVRKPTPAGAMVILRYRAAKVEGGKQETSWYEHYFDGGESGSPAPAPIHALSNGQYWLPPSNWRVTERGVEYFNARGSSGPSLDFFKEEKQPWY